MGRSEGGLIGVVEGNDVDCKGDKLTINGAFVGGIENLVGINGDLVGENDGLTGNNGDFVGC